MFIPSIRGRGIGVLLGLMIVTFCLIWGIQVGASSLDEESANIDWRQIKGESLYAIMNVHGCTDALKPLIPDFEKLTGAKLIMEEVSWGELVKKVPIELSSGKPSFDVLMLNHCFPLEYARAGWLDPLDPYLADPTLTDASWYDFADYSFGSYALQIADGKLYGIPIANDNQILFYRKDVFADQGISVPYTMDEMYEAGVKIKTDDLAGIIVRMKRGTGASWTWNGYVIDYGGMWIDQNNRVFLNSPQTIAGTEMYVKQAQDAGPEGILGCGWYECYNAFMQGRRLCSQMLRSLWGNLATPRNQRS